MSTDEIFSETDDAGSSGETSQVSTAEIFAHLGEAYSVPDEPNSPMLKKTGFPNLSQWRPACLAIMSIYELSMMISKHGDPSQNLLLRESKQMWKCWTGYL